TPRGEKVILLFVNRVKQEALTQYNDYLTGDLFEGVLRLGLPSAQKALVLAAVVAPEIAQVVVALRDEEAVHVPTLRGRGVVGQVPDVFQSPHLLPLKEALLPLEAARWVEAVRLQEEAQGPAVVLPEGGLDELVALVV